MRSAAVATFQKDHRGAASPGVAPHRLLRMPEVQKLCGLSRRTIFRRIEAGVFPSSVPLGGGIVAWVESEIAAVNAARIRGASDDEIEAIVSDLHDARKDCR